LRKKRLAAGSLAALLALTVLAVFLTGSGSARTQATYKVTLISDVGKFNDKGFNQSQLIGLNRAKTKFHIQVASFQSNSSSEYIPNLTAGARNGSHLVISAGFLMADATATVAAQFPKTHFAITDDTVSSAFGDFKGKDVHNIEGLTYATNENSYLIGYMAALVTKAEKKPHVIGAVMGVKIPPVDIFFAGYKAGAQKCVPGTKALFGYSNSFTAQDTCKTIAENQIAQKANVMFAIAGGCGLGALDAAKGAGIWGVGVDRDQSFLGTYILTSAVKRVDNGVILAIKNDKAGRFKGGSNAVYNLKNNGIGLGKISPKLPAKLKKQVMAKVNKLRKQIIKGKIKPPTTF
jgi:basic membrane protein A and related proteins